MTKNANLRRNPIERRSKRIHGTGVDLIALNEIRELAKNEQFVFLHDAKPMRCKKVRYFEHTDFVGKFDENPLEKEQNNTF